MRIIAVVCLMLAGCGPPGPRCLNPGADWTIWTATRADLSAEFVRRGGEYAPNRTCQSGFTDRERKQIWVVRGDEKALLHEVLIHGPDNAAARLYSPQFDLFYGDAPAETRAAAMALAEARKAGH
jgi:hypothetical protein